MLKIGRRYGVVRRGVEIKIVRREAKKLHYLVSGEVEDIVHII